ncbi:MAG: DUF1838 family protein [Rhodobacteraceae bacterium]|nr:DUF1838 family protein [Paracoccaceae bacterium]
MTGQFINSDHPSRRRALGAFGASALAASVATSAARAATGLNLEDPWDNLTAYLKARSDISGAVSVSWTSGYVYSHIPGQKARVLLLGQGVKCTRCIKDERGYEFLERECVIFSDPATAEPISTWRNPFTDRTVEVFHIRNASAGYHIDALGGPEDGGSAGAGGAASKGFRMNYMEHTGDVTFYDDLFYVSPSKLSLRDYAPYTAADVYEGAGIYHFHTKRADLDNPDLSSVPVTTSHTGIRQWLPWMEMGQWAGGVVLPSRGKKLKNVGEIPRPLLTWLEKNSPEFLDAPTARDKDKQKFFYEQFREHIDKKRAGEG